MRWWVLALLALSLSGLAAACAPLLVLGEKSLEICDGFAYDEIRGRLYRLERQGGPGADSRRFRFDLTKTCVVPATAALRALGITSMQVRGARGSSPRLEIELEARDARGDPFRCQGNLQVEGQEMIVTCPAEAGVSFRLIPVS